MTRLLVTLVVSVFVISAFGQIDHKEVNFVKVELKKVNVDMEEIYITDHYTSQGITHTYFKESINGIPVFNSRGAIHYKTRDQVYTKPRFRRKSTREVVSGSPKLTAIQALDRLALQKGFDRSGQVKLIERPSGSIQLQRIEATNISLTTIKSSLEYYYDNDEELRLIWTLPVEKVEDAWYTNYLVDANTGEIIEEIDWTIECNHGQAESHNSSCSEKFFGRKGHLDQKGKRSSSVVPNSYEVYAWPVESPNFGSRTTEVSPWLENAVASPNGWHTIGANSYTTSRGNNTDTYLDDNNSNSPTGGDAARADGGVDLDFSFPLDTDLPPEDYTDAAITNTFYWTNLMHDVWFNYGFDEASGNFQEENYTINGADSDYVRSEAQDGGNTCNANFATPPDGSNPRMQMYLCNGRDGDYDNGVIAHEYGHGISNRLTGGPSAANCLNTNNVNEQMGEGWSDYFGAVMTIESGDSGADSRGIGTWLFGQGPDGDGIRPFPYSTDFGINPVTYDNIKTFSIPHGVGSVWCAMLWDMTWGLIDEYGFDPDIYNGTGGNNIAMQLVMEGMKLQPCSPGFVDGRDAILEADEMLNGGANSCIIWKAFAERGLGVSADQGSSASRLDGTEAFDLPPSCKLTTYKTTLATVANEEDLLVYEIIVANGLADDVLNFQLTDTIPNELIFDSASDGGTESGGIITFPLFDLLSGEADTFEVILEVKLGISAVQSDIFDDVESGTGNWATTSSGSTSWSTQTDVSFSPNTAWFAPDNSSLGTAYLDMAFNVGIGAGSELAFYHQYDTENNYDGGQVFISTDEGETWIDLGPNMITNGYNNVIFNSVPGFSGNSNGFVNTVIDLDDYSGQNVRIRFQMNCDQSVGGAGWWIDDIAISNLRLITTNEAAGNNGTYFSKTFSNSVEILPPSTLLQANLTKTDAECFGSTNGEIALIVQGGTGNYTYAWNDGTTTQNRTNLGAGIYRVTISDGVDQMIKVGVIAEPASIDMSFDVENVTNFAGDNGSMEVFPSGGNGNYTYLWSTGATTQEITGLSEGVYVVTVTDGNNCMKVDSAEVIKYSCGDSHYDSGGPSSNYSSNEDMTVVFCPDNPDEGIVLTFNLIEIETNWDALYVHNGSSTSAPLFDSGNGPTQAGYPAGGYYGTNEPGPFTATNESGCITLRFRSDQYVTGDGWDIDISCTPCAGEVFNTDEEGYGSLVKEIDCADPVDVINFSDAVFLETIALDATILIDKELTMNPGMGNTVTIQSNMQGPIFNIAVGGSLDLDYIHLLSGELDPGGAIINNGTLTLKNVEVIGNENVPNAESLIENNGTINVQGNTSVRKE